MTTSVNKVVGRGELVAIAIFFAGQTAGAIWWASRMSTRMDRVEAVLQTTNSDHALIQRLDERTNNMNSALDRIERKLDNGK